MSTFAALFPTLLAVYLAGALHFLAVAVRDEDTRAHARECVPCTIGVVAAVVLLWPLILVTVAALGLWARASNALARRPL